MGRTHARVAAAQPAASALLSLATPGRQRGRVPPAEIRLLHQISPVRAVPARCRRRRWRGGRTRQPGLRAPSVTAARRVRRGARGRPERAKTLTLVCLCVSCRQAARLRSRKLAARRRRCGAAAAWRTRARAGRTAAALCA
jgi:hypothetical protein